MLISEVGEKEPARRRLKHERKMKGWKGKKKQSWSLIRTAETENNIEKNDKTKQKKSNTFDMPKFLKMSIKRKLYSKAYFI